MLRDYPHGIAMQQWAGFGGISRVDVASRRSNDRQRSSVSALGIGELRPGCDDRGCRKRRDACGGESTQRQCNVGSDVYCATLYYYGASQLDRIVAGRGHRQCDSRFVRADLGERREQVGFDFALQNQAGIHGVVRTRSYRRLGLASIESDAERLTSQLELVGSAEHAGAKFPRSLI